MLSILTHSLTIDVNEEAFFIMSSLSLFALAVPFLTPGASAYPSIGDVMNSTIQNILPNKGNGTMLDELSCYNLPYGGIGFMGHIFTYWTVLFLICGRRPLMPWTSLKYQRTDIVLDGVSLLIAVPLATFTIVRCIGRWQFVLLAVWKTTLAISLSAISFHRSWNLQKDTLNHRRQKNQAAITAQTTAYQPVPTNYADGLSVYSAAISPSLSGSSKENLIPQAPNSPVTLPPEADGPGFNGGLLWWLVLYGLGAFVGLIGLFSIVGHTYADNPLLRRVTGIFIAIAVTPPGCYIAGVIMYKIVSRPTPGKSKLELWGLVGHGTVVTVIVIFWIATLAAFYSDWVLGAIAHDLVGTPSDDNAVTYWTYFFAKRIPMFSA